MASSTPTEAEEVAALDKALTALGFTDDAKLERVLHVLMPRVVDQLNSAHASTKKKVLELLSHVNKRLKAHPSMPLPSRTSPRSAPTPKSAMVRNFALVYVERAHERATPEDRALRVLRSSAASRAAPSSSATSSSSASPSPPSPSPRNTSRRASTTCPSSRTPRIAPRS